MNPWSSEGDLVAKQPPYRSPEAFRNDGQHRFHVRIPEVAEPWSVPKKLDDIVFCEDTSSLRERSKCREFGSGPTQQNRTQQKMIRERLIANSFGSFLSLLDADGKSRIGLGVTKVGGGFTLLDGETKERVQVGVPDDGPVFWIKDEKGNGFGSKVLIRRRSYPQNVNCAVAFGGS